MADQEPPKPPAVVELTQVEKDRISRWFTANASNTACPICSTEDFRAQAATARAARGEHLILIARRVQLRSGKCARPAE
jgi:hypothetical protein